MKYIKRILILALVMLTLVSMASVCASDVNETEIASGDTNQVIEESGMDDNLAIGEDEAIAQTDNEAISEKDDGTFTALQNKIKNATSGSTITLENDYTYDEGFKTDGISIGKGLTINGNGHFIDALSKSRIFYDVSGREEDYILTLNNIVFKNGYADDGGAIYLEARSIFGPRVIINNCKFVSNHADFGGAIFSDTGRVLEITGCKFENNVATRSGGAIRSGTGCSIKNCNFIKNSAKEGGAIQLCSINSNADLSNCVFTSNSATVGGGAIYSNMDELEIYSCTFSSNTCKGNGGAICNELSALTVKNSKFDGNKAVNGGAIYFDGDAKSGSYFTAFVGNTKFSNNVATKSGGAIFDVTNRVTTSGCTFTGNKDADSKDSSPKLTPKLIAKKKTFKVKTKIKKYTATLKTNKNKAMKKVKLYLKVKGKTYTAKTNNKGKAIFKIKNLKKKGTYKAKITFKGNKNYKKVTKTVKIKVKK